MRIVCRLFIVLVIASTPLCGAQTKKPKAKPQAPSPPARVAPAPAPAPFPAGPVLDAASLKALKPRSIGPAIMGGRVSAVALDPKEPSTFYVALGTGGVMKTTDNGVTFEAVFEKESVAAIGAVAVAPSDP